MFVPLAEHVRHVAKNFIVLEFRLCPVWRPFFNFERLPISQVFAQAIHHFAEHAIRLAGVRLERTNLINQVIDHVAQVHGVEHAEAEVNRELQARLARSGLDPVAIFKEEHAEAIEPGVLQRKAVFRLVHAKAARPA